MAISAGVSMNAFAKVICKSLSVEQVEPIQIRGRNVGSRRIASHRALDFDAAFVDVMRGDFVWQIPILQSGH